MGRYSPSVLPQYYGGDPGAEIASAVAGYVEARRQKRRDELADVMNQVTLQNQGVERDPLAGSGNRDARAQRMQAERIPGVDPFQVPSEAPLTGPVATAPSRTMAATPSAAGRYRDLGDSGYRLDTQGTPEARAESTRLRLRDEAASEWAGAGYNEGESRLMAGQHEAIGPTMEAHDRATTRARQTASLADVQLLHPDRRALMAEYPALLPHELYPPPQERYQTQADRIELENLRGRNDLRVAGARAATADRERPMTIIEAANLIYGYNQGPDGRPRWTPGEQYTMARRLMAGTLTAAELGAKPAAPAAAPASDSGPGFLSRAATAFIRGAGEALGGAARGGVREPGEDTTTIDLSRPAAPATPAAGAPAVASRPAAKGKTAISQEEYDAAVADQGRAYAARHFTVRR